MSMADGQTVAVREPDTAGHSVSQPQAVHGDRTAGNFGSQTETPPWGTPAKVGISIAHSVLGAVLTPKSSISSFSGRDWVVSNQALIC
jgi:hypothetical protein